MELSKRGLNIKGKKKQQLEREFEELCRGVKNVPALSYKMPQKHHWVPFIYRTMRSCQQSLIKGHVINVIDE